MSVALHCALSDPYLDSQQTASQRQLAISIQVAAAGMGSHAPLNLGLILDHSGSMHGPPLTMVKEAAGRLVDQLSDEDLLSVIVFDHQAKVLLPLQTVSDRDLIKRKIGILKPSGGTAIDEGMKLGIEEAAQGKQGKVSQLFLLTDGENEHGDNKRCLKLAEVAADYTLTLNALGFGDHWNQDVLEKIADAGAGTLSYIEEPDAAVDEFNRLLTRAQSVFFTNAHLHLSLLPGVRLAELKPIAQVAPETIELPYLQEENEIVIRLGDLMSETPRVVLTNLYIGGQGEGTFPIVRAYIRYDSPATDQMGLQSESVEVSAISQSTYQPSPDQHVQKHVLTLAKYRQTQIAEQKLAKGDRQGAATLLQSAAKTALQMGDQGAATVLQENATRLQTGQDLSERDRKRTRIVSKTRLQ
ncbi:VWA domain-containing protein [Oscillatoria sp. CS-180]|uniref:vWA domain-containing protein n=1 Tax=Oscillatoria sp. CS-180 TaxID=3021720 RepID=UPI00232EE1A1|nr:VWA domain-containing protein [Oscillatoria sp. CS-180]MDB9525866.1 VWA domain-containing protein [Oscillatoria sp. CS-180]